MANQDWNRTEINNTDYWHIQLAEDDTIKIAVAQKRKCGKPFPYLLVFNELLNPDHHYRGRQRFGHGHQVKLEYFYFDASGSGRYLTGEELRWLPHYDTELMSKKESLALDVQLRERLGELPIKALYSDAIKNLHCISINEPEVNLVSGVQLELMLALYQDLEMFEEQKERILEDESESEWKRRFRKIPGFQFNLTLPEDKLRYTLGLLKRVTGYDVYDSNRNAQALLDVQHTGKPAFPGPIDFLQGLDKEDDVGKPGNSGINFR